MTDEQKQKIRDRAAVDARGWKRRTDGAVEQFEHMERARRERLVAVARRMADA